MASHFAVASLFKVNLMPSAPGASSALSITTAELDSVKKACSLEAYTSPFDQI